MSLIAGEHGNTGRADGAGADARFSRIFDADIDSKGTIYVSEPRRLGSGADYYSGYAVRSVERGGMVRTMYADPVDDQHDPWHDYDGPRLSIDARDQVYCTVLSQTLALGKDGTATPLPFGRGGGRRVTSASGIGYRITTHEILRVEADGKETLLAGCSPYSAPDANDVTPPPRPCATEGPGVGVGVEWIRVDTVTLDPAGNLYFADETRIRKMTPQGMISTVAGVDWTPERQSARDGQGGAARFANPASMAYHDGQLLVIDHFVLRRVSLDGVVTTSAIALPEARALLADREGTLFVVFNQHISILGADGKLTLFAGKPNLSETAVDGIGAAARLRGPHGLALTPSGTLYAIERPVLRHDTLGAFPVSGIHLRKIAPDGSVTTLFRAGGIASGIAADKAGNIYISTVASYLEASPSGQEIVMLSPEGEWRAYVGTTANGASRGAIFQAPYILGFDKEGDLYVRDAHKVLHRVTPQRYVIPVKTGVPPEVGAAFDEAGNRYVTDAAANTVTRITPAGVSTIVAGKAGPALAIPGAAPVTLDNPRGIVRIGANSYALISGNAIVKLTLP
ncbi:hypothetical protein F2P46_07915 [Massilia sp. CCM 8734]|nr:hypothetical protein [Massilia sp. CCM 8734]